MLYVNFVHKKKEPVVEQVFLIYEDGRLIAHSSLGREKEIDEDILSGMLTGVMNLLSTVFINKEKGDKDVEQYKFELGERTVILDMGNKFFLAIVLLGRENKTLLTKSKAVIRDIEDKYDDKLERWEGKMRDFEGAHEIITSLLSLEKIPEAEREVIKDEGMTKKVFELWSTKYVKFIEESLMPKARTWQSLKWTLKDGLEKALKDEEEAEKEAGGKDEGEEKK
ncbi:MAG: roadblock/LC7 domain-containing protein [Thermoplasmata archaeon]|nr:MAG: roadblock/LC7 domain-containing protein [Thermoplasmata archaeon]